MAKSPLAVKPSAQGRGRRGKELVGEMDLRQIDGFDHGIDQKVSRGPEGGDLEEKG